MKRLAKVLHRFWDPDSMAFSLMLYVIFFAVVGYFMAKGSNPLRGTAQYTLPTAPPIDDAKCAQLGQKLLEKEVYLLGLDYPDAQSSQVSHYDQRSNRCYVKVDYRWDKNHDSGLFDGQTGEELARATEVEWGSIHSEPSDYATAQTFIDAMMEERR